MTLVFGRAFAGLLAGLEVAMFVTGVLLVAGSVLAHAARMRPAGLELAAGLGLVAIAILSVVRVVGVVERSHLAEYGAVAVLVHAALDERARNGRRVHAPAGLAFAITVAIGAVDEGVQALIPWRVFDPVDLVFNAAAAAFGVGASVAAGWVRGSWERQRGR